MSGKPGLIRRMLAKLCLIEDPDDSVGQSTLADIPLSLPSLHDNYTRVARRMRTDTAKHRAVQTEEERAEQMSELRRNRTQLDESCNRDVKEQVTLMQTLSLLKAQGELHKRSNGSRRLDVVHVLVISDDSFSIDRIAKRLRATAYKQEFVVNAARTPEDGLHHLALNHVDAVFLDINFGIVDVNIRKFMQANGDAIKVPVFILTASLESQTAATLKQSGVLDVIDKRRIQSAPLVDIINKSIDQEASGVRKSV